jgi:RNA polymerase sigma factor (sigma-70 family)
MARIAVAVGRMRQAAGVRESADKLAGAMTSAMASGDEKAVELFHRSYFDLLYRAARRATGRDESFCLDVVQESLMRILRTVQRVDSEAQLAAWLWLVVRTTAYDLLRSESRRRRREASVAAGAIDIDSRELAAAEEDERLAWLRNQIHQLDAKIILAIDLRYRRGWSLGRVAQALGVSIGTVDGRLRRALAKLRRAGIDAGVEEDDD